MQALLDNLQLLAKRDVQGLLRAVRRFRPKTSPT